MTQNNKAIVPKQAEPLILKPRGVKSIVVVHRQPCDRTTQSPVPARITTAPNQLPEVAGYLVGALALIFGCSLIALSVIHMGNAVYWQGERMHQRIQPGYLGGSWNEQ